MAPAYALRRLTSADPHRDIALQDRSAMWRLFQRANDMSFRALLLGVMVATSSVMASPASSASTTPESSIDTQLQQLSQYATTYGVTLSDVRVAQAVGFKSLPPGFMSSQSADASCTATATISIPGGTGVTLSATAPTCTQAISMLQQAISHYLQMMPHAR